MRRNVRIGAALCVRLSTPSLSLRPLLPPSQPSPAQCKPLITITTLLGAGRWVSSTSSRQDRTVQRQSNRPRPDPTAANPPASTRPPALELPVREPTTSSFRHLFSTGKAYLTFYKTGLKQIVENHRLRFSPARPPTGTRADFLLQVRHAHDMRRLPLFALLLLVCGEFTPLVVLAVPSIVPYTCRIPRQVDKLLRESEERRARALEDFARKFSEGPDLSDDVAAGHLARVLDVVAPLWERIGITLPAAVVSGRVMRRIKFLAEDDTLLVKAGGVEALQWEEVKLACADRAIRVRGRDENELRTALAKWLRLVRPETVEGSARSIVSLLLTREERWPMQLAGS